MQSSSLGVADTWCPLVSCRRKTLGFSCESKTNSSQSMGFVGKCISAEEALKVYMKGKILF